MNTAKDYYLISYWFDSEDSQLSISILKNSKHVYSEDILGDFEDEEDLKLTCMEIAKSHGYYPVLFENDAKTYGRAGGKKSSVNMTADERTNRARKAAKIRWKKKTTTEKQ